MRQKAHNNFTLDILARMVFDLKHSMVAVSAYAIPAYTVP